MAAQLPEDSQCYTDDWKRTNPDFVVHLPKERCGPDAHSDHFLVEVTPGGNLLAMWTMSGVEGSSDTRVHAARTTAGPGPRPSFLWVGKETRGPRACSGSRWSARLAGHGSETHVPFRW